MALRTLALMLLAGCVSHARMPRTAPEAPPERAPVYGLANIQRAMRLLATSSPAEPHRLRVLFYGQSITESAWSEAVASRLRERFPHAQLEIENRALGGYAAERLLQTAESDLYPWQPDLVIFHAYGDHEKYEALIAQVRARTSAEVLIQNDHVTSDAELHESLDPSAHPRDAAHWPGFMNHVFLPSLVARHQVALCDVRAAWKGWLRAERAQARSLLADEVHLNAQGDARMAQLVDSCLVRDPALRSPAEAWVEAYPASGHLVFVGHRVDLTVEKGEGSLEVRIDGRPPSALGLGTFARAVVRGGGKWPPLHGVEHGRALVPETVLLTLRREGARHHFRVWGSVSGDEGEGSTDARFQSRSERVVIEPVDWDIAYAFQMMGAAVPDTFEVELGVLPQAVDTVVAGHRAQTVTVASGLAPGQHLLELRGKAPLRGITIYRAAGRAQAP
jgi:hypothetical protein